MTQYFDGLKLAVVLAYKEKPSITLAQVVQHQKTLQKFLS
jgi:hypothetical protein